VEERSFLAKLFETIRYLQEENKLMDDQTKKLLKECNVGFKV